VVDTSDMTTIDPDARAELVETIHQPWKASVRDCLARWRQVPAAARDCCYLVLHDGPAARRTLNAGRLAELDALIG
jgi:hypothetical protein